MNAAQATFARAALVQTPEWIQQLQSLGGSLRAVIRFALRFYDPGGASWVQVLQLKKLAVAVVRVPTCMRYSPTPEIHLQPARLGCNGLRAQHGNLTHIPPRSGSCSPPSRPASRAEQLQWGSTLFSKPGPLRRDLC